jgi:hypothetical protein
LPSENCRVWFFRGKSIPGNEDWQMPKILPIIGALLTIAAAIGWNTARYPMVWEMVGPAAASSPSSSADVASTAAQPAQAKPKEPAPAPAADPPVLAETKKDPPAPVQTEKHEAKNTSVVASRPDSQPALHEQPLEVTPVARGTGCQPVLQEKDADREPAPWNELKADSGSSAANGSPASADVQRLPPPDAETAPTPSADSPDAAPLYPQTGY